MAPWWFLCKPKHAGAAPTILICFNISTFFMLFALVGIIKCLISLMHSCNHEDSLEMSSIYWLRLQVLTVVLLKIHVLWDVTLACYMSSFGGLICLCLQGQIVQEECLTLQMKVLRTVLKFQELLTLGRFILHLSESSWWFSDVTSTLRSRWPRVLPLYTSFSSSPLPHLHHHYQRK